MTGARFGPAQPVDVVGLGDVMEHVGDPFTLQPGHHLRGLRCLLCGMLIGGRLARFAVAIDTRAPVTACGGARSAAFLICAEHEDGSKPDIATPAIDRCSRYHQPRAS